MKITDPILNQKILMPFNQKMKGRDFAHVLLKSGRDVVALIGEGLRGWVLFDVLYNDEYAKREARKIVQRTGFKNVRIKRITL